MVSAKPTIIIILIKFDELAFMQFMPQGNSFPDAADLIHTVIGNDHVHLKKRAEDRR